MVKTILYLLLMLCSYNIAYSDEAQKSCVDYPLSFASCLASACQATYAFGIAHYQITGLDKQNQCIFYEGIDNIGGMKCTIPQNVLSEFSKQVSAYIRTMTSLGAISSELATTIANLRNKYCIPMLWPNIKSEVIVNQDLLPKRPLSPLSKEDNPLLKHKAQDLNSVVFDQKELDLIEQAVNQYQGSVSGKIANYIGDAVGSQNSYLLQSILYMDDERWVVWLNNRKLYSDRLDDGMKFLNINSNGLILELDLEDLDLLSPGWREKATQKGDRYIIEDNNIVIRNKDSRYILDVPLGLHQQFSLSDMMIK